MDAEIILRRPGKGAVARSIQLVGDPRDLETITTPLAWRILEELKRQPDFPGSIAKRLRVHEQKVYYHVRRMSKAGILKVVREENRRGGICRYYAPVADAFGAQLSGKGTPVTGGPGTVPQKLRDFLKDFSKDGVLDALVVVGSPSAHGPFLTVARDSPYAVQLGLRLGQLFSPPKSTSLRLDTEVKAEGAEKTNMILVGGPVANIVSLEINERLKVRLEWREVWRIQSDLTGRVYSEETTALVAKVPNPWKEGKKLLLLWGLHYIGTFAAILAITQHSDKILKDYREDSEFYRVVLGQDRDGDGKIDEIEILE